MDENQVQSCCAISYCGWKDGIQLVGDLNHFFAKMCYEADELLSEPAECRYFLNWFDKTPRDEMRSELLKEVDLALAKREKEK